MGFSESARKGGRGATALVLASFALGAAAFLGLQAFTVRASTPPLRVEGDSRALDLGRVTEGSIVARTIKLRNTGTEPLHVLGIETSCGCTTTEAPKVFAPGDVGSVTVHFDSVGKLGPIHQSISIFVRGYENRPLYGAITGRVVRAEEKTPAARPKVPTGVSSSQSAACESN